MVKTVGEKDEVPWWVREGLHYCIQSRWSKSIIHNEIKQQNQWINDQYNTWYNLFCNNKNYNIVFDILKKE